MREIIFTKRPYAPIWANPTHTVGGMDKDLEAALEAARAGAEVVRHGFSTRPEVRLKGDVDPVTAVDNDAEEAIFEVLAQVAPGEEVLGEESGGAGWDSDRVWIVDPLDGTVNFIHGLPHVSVSVAVWEDGHPMAGVVIDVLRREEFGASKGSGTWLNDGRVSVSTQLDMKASLMVTGFPYDRQDRPTAYAAVVGAVLGQVQGVRRLGSAALDFAWVACGRFDGYWEYGLAPWDSAAGILLVTEAGGRVTDHLGNHFRLDSKTVVATNGRLHDRLTTIISDHLPEHLR